ncbi:hypothetical protein B484DRAFT_468586 [Ochromonadaceae sp. CCMP2298]|nr:hypothetical protein B484DRAFT_468586 [Ochromonadaceae sp. CCMP2298]
MKSFHITCERVNADGFKRLREKVESETRNERACDRNKLITADAQKLIGQMLAARLVPRFAQWKTWTDLEFFETMAKLYPSGKVAQIKHLQDFLTKTTFNWWLDNHWLSLQAFVTEINEGTRIYARDLEAAREKGCIDSVMREVVTTLINRITSGPNDSERQPAGVRARLKARILFAGKPNDIEDFILKLITEAQVISEAHSEMSSCGFYYKAIAKKPEPGAVKTGNQQQQQQRVKQEAPSEFVCNGCGGSKHKYRDCPMKQHPDFNASRAAWADSDVGKRYAAVSKNRLTFGVNEKGDKVVGGQAVRPKGQWAGKKGKHLHIDAPLLDHLFAVLKNTDDKYLVTGAVHGTQTNTDTPTNNPRTP